MLKFINSLFLTTPLSFENHTLSIPIKEKRLNNLSNLKLSVHIPVYRPLFEIDKKIIAGDNLKQIRVDILNDIGFDIYAKAVDKPEYLLDLLYIMRKVAELDLKVDVLYSSLDKQNFITIKNLLNQIKTRIDTLSKDSKEKLYVYNTYLSLQIMEAIQDIEKIIKN